MVRLALLTLTGLLAALPARGADGLVELNSAHSVRETADRLQDLLLRKGLRVFARVNHAENARGVDLELPPTVLSIFGNPRLGTPLMHCAPTVAIDLPQKMLIRQTGEGGVLLSYNDPRYLASRHGIEGCDEVLGRIQQALDGLARAATRPAPL